MHEPLKNCPFCGCKAVASINKDESLWSHDVVDWTRVHCTNDECNAQTEATCEGYEPSAIEVWNRRTPQPVVREPQCWCLTCRPMRVDDPESIRMALCPTCGNKRCPKANNHRNQCSNSNEPGQKGSAYEGCGITQKGGD